MSKGEKLSQKDLEFGEKTEKEILDWESPKTENQFLEDSDNINDICNIDL